MADMKTIKFPGSDTIYSPVDQVARDEAAKKLNADQLPTAIETALAQAKESGEFNGADGTPGKTAYEYAQDGGYTGTEEEFAAKLAAEWQGKLTGTQGQVVGFDAEGNAVALLYQHDWNQNDETAADFIKNRPFGDELVETMPETEITGEEEDGGYVAPIPDGVIIDGIDTIVVTFDGVEYVCNAKFDGMLYGNSVFIGEEDTGEPFAIVPFFGQIVVEDAEPHSISIAKFEAIKLPDKYYDVANYCFLNIGDSSDVYIYTDATLTTKMTLEQLQALPKTKPIIVRYAGVYGVNNAVAGIALYVEAIPGSTYGSIATCINTGIKWFSTAEYTPPTT